MAEGILLDNDVVLKACAYRCHDAMVATTTLHEKPPSMLRIARFTLRSRLSRPGGIADPEGAAAALDQLLACVRLLDPAQEEIELAAELEELATAQMLAFDTGESQLVAILMLRGAALLVTGDKRAIAALAGLDLAPTKRRIACLEQLVLMLLQPDHHETVRQRVCAEPGADKALTACFSCTSELVPVEDILHGLNSYVNHLRKATGDMLIANDDLLAIVS